ncbi:hypothetical protein PIROE2DRAFT_61010 [Piromyces sp. E2]|nr:hypothetical protein PIROE2DRAFT_61010 [Piromyces sp. E2]|eukprot:OUM63939.1 hypothetical protein PIROE2DRAFT_61010 [Piromyces sp. E2]
MEFNLISNNFDGNKAKNGGALYFKNGKNIDNINNRPINIENNNFNNNMADYFGGAIYSEYSKLFLASITNNVIKDNNAGIMGGGIYSPKSIDKNLFRVEDNFYENNKYDDYATGPAYIELDKSKIKIDNNETISLKTGDRLPLSFIMKDEFNNIIVDVTKYYSSIILKVILQRKDKNEIEEEEDSDHYYHLTGNIGTFSRGN